MDGDERHLSSSIGSPEPVTPDLRLRTLYVLDGRGRMVAAREPAPAGPAPLFTIIRSATSCAWAVRDDVPDAVADELNRLAGEEPPLTDFRLTPTHADEYMALAGGRVSSGPAFAFPDHIDRSTGIKEIDDERLLLHHFRGWVPGEIAAGRAPVMAIVEDGHPVSVCFCARRTCEAAEAGLETAEPYRGRGYGARVTAAWALAVRASGRIPIYSTSWDNAASLAVARRLGLAPCTSDWSLTD